MNIQAIGDHGFSLPSIGPGFPEDQQDHSNANPNPNPKPPPSTAVKKKRNLPGTPDPDAEVIALSPKTLMATNRFICEICNKGFQRDQNLQLHRRGHNLPWKLRQRSNKEQVKKKVYICPEKSCVHHDPSRALGDLTGIKKHFSRKHGEKKWKCEKCSKKYAVQSDWKAHTKTCGTREYKCDCGTLFSRKDSFITHRAFCDALAEESARNIASVTPSSLSFKSDPISKSTLNNLQPGFHHGFVGQGLQDTTAISNFNRLFRSDFGSMAAGTPHTAGLPEMVQMATANLFGSSSIPNFGMSNQFTATSSSNTSSLTLSSFPVLALKGEGGNNNNVKNNNMVESLSSMYSNDHVTHNQNNQPSSASSYNSSPMSATALLQKAAQIGSTRNNTFLGTSLGVMASSPSNNTTNVSVTSVSVSSAERVGGSAGPSSNPNVGSLASSISELDQLMMQSSSTKSQTETIQLKFHQGSKGVDNNGPTRDFLGMGAGDHGNHIRPFLPQGLANFASVSSTMGMNHFVGSK